MSLIKNKTMTEMTIITLIFGIITILLLYILRCYLRHEKAMINKELKRQYVHCFHADNNEIFFERVFTSDVTYKGVKKEFYSHKQNKTILCDFEIKQTLVLDNVVYYYYFPVL
jgi:hypothetical protein